MSSPLRRASASFKSRLTIVANFIKPKRINASQQNYVAATSTSLPINKEEDGPKCYSFKEDITKQDSVETSYYSNQWLDCNTPQLQKSKFLACNSENLKNNAQIYSSSRSFCLKTKPPSSPKDPPPPTNVKPTKTEQLKRAFKEYGPAIMGFHMAISMMSLGGVYALVSGGMDLEPILKFLGFSSSNLTDNVTTGGTFVVAFAIHKILAPIRISITLGATPFVVRYLRSKGLMKAKTKAL